MIRDQSRDGGTGTESGLVGTQWGKEMVERTERAALTYIHTRPHVKHTASRKLLCSTGSSAHGSVMPRRVPGGGRQAQDGGGMYVNLQLIQAGLKLNTQKN